jgi:hypothetical protein
MAAIDRAAGNGDARPPGRADAALRSLRWLRSAGRRPNPEYSVPSWARWTAASVAVVIDWLLSGGHGGPGSYGYLLIFVALMIYPDAQAISVAGLRFERLRTKVAEQDAQLATLHEHVQQLTAINNRTHQVVTIALGDPALASKIAAGEQAPQQPWAAAAAQYLAASQEAPGEPSHFQAPDVSSEGGQDEAGPERPRTSG